MANVAHSTLTGANLHEPKGIASAGANLVYLSNGSGSGSWSTVPNAALAADAKPSVIFIAKKTASSSSSLHFNNTEITSTYNKYIISFDALVPATNGDVLRMYLSTDNGSTLINTNYRRSIYGIVPEGISGSYSGTDNAIYLSFPTSLNTTNGITNVTGRGVTGEVIIHPNGTQDRIIVGQIGYLRATDGAPIGFSLTASYSASQSAVNYLQFSMANSNIASGSVSLYGVLDV